MNPGFSPTLVPRVVLAGLAGSVGRVTGVPLGNNGAEGRLGGEVAADAIQFLLLYLPGSRDQVHFMAFLSDWGPFDEQRLHGKLSFLLRFYAMKKPHMAQQSVKNRVGY